MREKILFCPCHYVYDSEGGSEFSWSFNIAHRLALKNKNSLIITGKNRSTHLHPYQVLEIQKKKENIDLSLRNAIIYNLKYSLETFRRFKSGKFDILHHVLPFSIDYTFNLFIIFHYFFHSKKNIFIIGPVQSPLTYHDLDRDASDMRSETSSKKEIFNFNFNFIFEILKPILSFLSKKTLERADKIIVINEYTKKMLLERALPEEKILIISPGITSEDFLYFKKKKKEKCLELITVGYLLQRKGVELILSAVERLIKEGENIRYHIVGNGPQKENLERMVLEKGLKNNVIFYGFIPNSKVQSLYHKADVFVSMTRSESWGQMYLEAMACGLPIITTENIGSNEIIKNNGEFGFLVEQENIDQLIDKIKYFIDNPQSIEVFGKRARKEVETKYDWDKIIIPQYEKMYHDLITK